MHLFDLFEDNATEGKILHPNRINLYLNLRKPNAKPIVVGHNIPYKAMDAVIQKIVDKYSNIEADMFEFRPVGSLREDSGENDLFAAYDKILIDLCAGIIKHQKQNSDRYGLVAAAVVDPDHNVVYGINHKLASGKRVHAERAAMANYIKRHGVIPKNSIIITTLSPCTDDMPDRKGPSCTELLNGSPITRVYAGYRDPSQTHLSHDEFDVVYTQNSKIESVCKQIADCFLKESAYTDPANYRSEGVAEGATVTRIDSKPITDFGSSLKAYKHTDDWSQSGVDTGDDSYWKNKNLKTNTTKGLFAGDPKRTALYATGNAHETRYVEFTQDGQPIVYFDRKDLPAMRSRKTYLTVFDANDFRQLPTGEWFSENPGKPIKQVPIGDPFKYIASQGWVVRVTDDLDKVFKQVKNMHKAGKIVQYGAEGMNESKQGVAEAFDNPYKTKTEKSDYGDVDMLAKLPDGTNLSIMFNNQGDDEWQVEFYRNNSQEVTGEGDAQRVFATVLASMQKFIKKYKPWRLTFSATKLLDPSTYYEPDQPVPNPESRAKLYNRLVQRYATAWGYEEYAEDHGDQITYELTRLKPGMAEGATKIHSDKEPKLTGFSFQQLDSLCESAGSDYVKFDRAIKKNLVLPAWTNTLELYGVYARKLNEVKSKTLAEGTQSDIEQQLFDQLSQRALGNMDSASVGDRVSLLHLATLNIPGHKVVAKLNGFLTPKQIVKIVNTGRFQQLEFADGSRYPEKDGGDIFQQAQTWNMTKLFPSADAASKAFMFYMLEGQKLSDVLDFQTNVDQGVVENFADGKNPGRKGLAKRSGVNTKASVSSLRKTAKHSTGEKARMAHWLANMKAGKKKHAKEAVDEDAINEIENLQSYQYTGGKDVLKHPRYTDPDAVSRKNIKPLPGGSGLNYATIDHGRFLEIRMLDQSGQEAVGQLKLMRVGFPINNAYQVSTVTVDEDYRGKGIAKSLYGVALSILKITLLAGSQQTPGGKRNWMSLAQIPGVEVRGYVELENSDLKYKKLHKQKNAKDLANAERRNAIVDKNIDIVMGRLGGDYLGDDEDGNMIFAFDVVPGTGSLTPAVKTELNKLYYGEYDMLYVTGLYAQWRGA